MVDVAGADLDVDAHGDIFDVVDERVVEGQHGEVEIVAEEIDSVGVQIDRRRGLTVDDPVAVFRLFLSKWR